MDLLSPPPPSGDISEKPDTYTRLNVKDYTGKDAQDRVLHINLKFFKYGTDDKSHAAAVALSFLLIIVIVIVMLIGLFSKNNEWLDRIFTWLGSAFLFVSGVAVGRGTNLSSKEPEH